MSTDCVEELKSRDSRSDLFGQYNVELQTRVHIEEA